jgi:uncharacterized membrane protein YkoI
MELTMKGSLRTLFLVLFTLLSLAGGYAFAQEETQEENTNTSKGSEEVEGPEVSQNSAAIESFGSVSLVDAVKIAQMALGSDTPPFEATLQKNDGQLVWLLDFVSPAQQVIVDAESGAVVGTTDLPEVPTPDAALTDYGSLELAEIIEIAQQAYGSQEDVTELALEKYEGKLVWRVDVVDKLVTIDAATGEVVSVGALD